MPCLLPVKIDDRLNLRESRFHVEQPGQPPATIGLVAGDTGLGHDDRLGESDHQIVFFLERIGKGLRPAIVVLVRLLQREHRQADIVDDIRAGIIRGEIGLAALGARGRQVATKCR